MNIFLAPVDRERDRLNRKQHLALKASYTFLDQYSTHTPETFQNQISGRLDFQGVWTFHQSGQDTSTLNLLLRSGTNIGQSQQRNLSDNAGSLLGTNSLQGGGPQRPVMINLLYLKQTWSAQKIALYIGKLHPNQHIDLSPVNDDETSQFLGGPFDGNPAEPKLGAYTPGVALEIGQPNGVYTHALVVDSEALPWNGLQTLSQGRLYKAVEVGWKQKLQGEGGRDVRFDFWHNDQREVGHGHGFGIGADWQFHNNWMPFARFGVHSQYGSAVKQVETFGITHVLPFQHRGEMFGAAFTWTLPAQYAQHREQLSEAFYRVKISDSLELTPDFQLLRHPANATAKQPMRTAIFGLRLKVIF